MSFPVNRPRRLRLNETIRKMVRENFISVNDLIYPLFIVKGKNIKEEIPSMPDVFHFSIDKLKEEIKEISSLKIPSVLLFGANEEKDDYASFAYKKDGTIQNAIKEIKNLNPNINVITDVCLCAYTKTGHCGIYKNEKIDNDATLEILSKIALSHANSGADIVAPSDMMDGRVKAIRNVLDQNHFKDTLIMSYSAKYASAFYGPFRDASDCAPKFGDRKTYQMDPANIREAIKEVFLDIEEGADLVMIKPALSYLDVIAKIKEKTIIPVVAYNVSGEYSMIKFAAKNNLIEEKKIIMEILLSMKRAGADLIITYFAKEVAKLLGEEK